MYRRFASFGLLLSILSVVGCQQQAASSHSLDSIISAYQQSLLDGQFATRLGVFVHPELGSLPDGNLMLADRATDADEKATLQETSAVRELTTAEKTELQQFFDFAVPPTHVIDFTTVNKKGPTTWTKISPLYLVRSGDGWNVVVGTFKAPEQLTKSFEHEQLSFEADQGGWQHHWELQFELNSPCRYEVVLRKAGSTEAIETILAKEDIRFCDDQKVIRFHTLPQDAACAWETSATGRTSLPYACQAGTRATSAWVDLPATGITSYEPNRQPRFEGNSIVLATLAGQGETGPVALEVVVNRLEQ